MGRSKQREVAMFHIGACLKNWHARLLAVILFNSSMWFGIWLASALGRSIGDTDWFVLKAAVVIWIVLLVVAVPMGSVMIMLGWMDSRNPHIEREYSAGRNWPWR